MSGKNVTEAAAGMPASFRPDGEACKQYWRLYWAWVRAPERERPVHLGRLRDHLAVCGCRLGLGGRWSPMEDPIHEDEKAGGWDVSS